MQERLTSWSSIYKLERSDNEVPELNKGAPACTWCSYKFILSRRRDIDIKMHVVELTVSSYIAKNISSCALMSTFCFTLLLQYKGQPFIEFRGNSKAAAACMYALGYFLLLLVGIAVGMVALCRAIKVSLQCCLNNNK